MAAGDGITVRTIMVSTKATARSKTNFSVLHLRAAHAAREAYEIEQPQYGDWFLEMYGLVTVSIVMAAAALEANANEIVQDNLDAEKRGAVQITDGQRLLELKEKLSPTMNEVPQAREVARERSRHWERRLERCR